MIHYGRRHVIACKDHFTVNPEGSYFIFIKLIIIGIDKNELNLVGNFMRLYDVKPTDDYTFYLQFNALNRLINP